MNDKNKKIILLVAAVVGAVILPLLITSGYLIQSLIMVLLYAYWASCWNIIGGYGGQLSIGHSTYAGIGAYVTVILLINYNISPWMGMFAGALVSGILSIIIGFPCFRLQGSYFTLSTVALAHVIRIIFLQEDKILGFQTNGAMGVKVPWIGESLKYMQFIDKRGYYFIILVFLIMITFISWKIKNSRMGYYLSAINTNQKAAASLGVDVQKYKLMAMFISAFTTALGGAFYAMLILFIDPERMLGYDLSVQIMVFAIVGGRGTLFGPILGAMVMVPISELSRTYLGTSLAGVSIIIYGVVLMLIVYFLPGGLVSIKDKLRFGKKRDNGKLEVSEVME